MPAISEQQRRAMEAAAHGKSTLGIPKAVGEEFVGKDAAPQAAGIVFVAPDGDVLLLRRAATEKNYAGHWGLPGGGAEDGETASQAALREAREEIGFEPAVKNIILKLLDRVETPNGMHFSTFGLGLDDKFEPKLNDEHDEARWFPLNALPQPLHPSVAKTLGPHIGVTEDMSPDDWQGLRAGFSKWIREEEHEAEHAQDERIAFDKQTVRTYDADGHLHVSRTPISKANVCEYFGYEIPDAEGLGLDPQRKYKLLRDPKELEKAAATSNGKPLLIKHVPTSADDHQSDLTVGSVGTGAKYEHPYLTNSLTIWDRKGIDGIEDETQKELSSAYRYRADMTPGEYEGAPYDGVMRDIDFNHVALVPEGRAGADVVVGDAKPSPTNGEIQMSKTVLTRKGTFIAGAVAMHLIPKLAQDAKFDVTPAFAGVTAKNFKAQKTKIVDYIKNKAPLAKDANLDDLTALLDTLDKVPVTEGNDLDPSSGLPMTAKPKGTDEEEDMDDRAKKIAAFKEKAGMDEDMSNAFDELMGDLDGMDGDEPKPVAGKAAAADEDDDKEPKVTKAAMDAAIAKASKAATESALKTANEIADARDFASKWVGRLAMDARAPEDVYKAALETLKVDVDGVHPSALRKILEVQPVPGARKETMASDESIPDATGFTKRFGAITDRISIAG